MHHHGQPHPHPHPHDPRMIHKEEEIVQVLNKYYPEVQFFRKLLLFEYFPLTIIFYGVIHLIFYYFSTTQDSLVSILIMFGIVALVAWKVGSHVVLPTYLQARKRTMSKTGKKPEIVAEEEAYKHRLAHRLAFISLFKEDSKHYLEDIHSNEPTKFLSIMLTIGFILFFIGNYIPGIIIAYIVVLFLLIWPILVHNRLPQALDGFYQIVAPHVNVLKDRVVEGASKIPRPKLDTADILPLTPESVPESLLEQSLAMGPGMYPPSSFPQHSYAPIHPVPQNQGYPPTTQQGYYTAPPQEANLRNRGHFAPMAPNTPPSSTQQREIADAIQAQDEFGRPYNLGEDEFEMVDGSLIPKNFDS